MKNLSTFNKTTFVNALANHLQISTNRVEVVSTVPTSPASRRRLEALLQVNTRILPREVGSLEATLADISTSLKRDIAREELNVGYAHDHSLASVTSITTPVTPATPATTTTESQISSDLAETVSMSLETALGIVICFVLVQIILIIWIHQYVRRHSNRDPPSENTESHSFLCCTIEKTS